MERINAANSRVVAWSALLDKSHAVLEPKSSVEAISAPEPRELLEQERSRVLEEAMKAGHAQGSKRADDEIRAAIEKAERRIEEANASERERLSSANRQMRELLDSLPKAIAEVDTRLEAAVVETAYASVLRLLGEDAADRALIVAVCRQALDECRQRPVVLRVAIADAAVVAELADADSVRVTGDVRLASGECQLETHKGIYETSLEVRLEGLKQAFLRSLPAEGMRK